MKKHTKIALLVSVILIFAGAGLFTAGAAFRGFDFTGIWQRKLISGEYKAEENFSEIEALGEISCDIEIMKSDDGTCRIEYVSAEYIEHSIRVESSKLIISCKDTSKWYEHLFKIGWGTDYIKIYLPENEYNAISLKTVSGDIYIPGNFTFNEIYAKSTSGDIESEAAAKSKFYAKTTSGDIMVKNVKCEASLNSTSGDIKLSGFETDGGISVKTTSGDIKLDNIKAGELNIDTTSGDVSTYFAIISGNAVIKSTSGEIDFEKCDAAEFHIETVSGDVKCRILSPKFFQIKTTSGDIDVPQSDKSAGLFYVETTSGDIDVEII